MSESNSIQRDEKKHLTIYKPEGTPLARILYLHGGGLLYGTREDLPEYHLKRFAKEGLEVLALDYLLAPASELEEILSALSNTINDVIASSSQIPFFLLGRSSGAYLALLLAGKEMLTLKPAGVLSWYGYGFLCDGWYEEPATFYRKLPAVPAPALMMIPKRSEGALTDSYSLYVYARQTGSWKSMFYHGREKFFFLDYSLRTVDTFPCPLFAAHSMMDPDVPFAEFQALTQKYPSAKRMIVPGREHDFDRNPDNPQTQKLLNESIAFIQEKAGLA